jgi:hypothetical protein
MSQEFELLFLVHLLGLSNQSHQLHLLDLLRLFHPEYQLDRLHL